jgi:small nuclear ribonucleoprotein (snRNP)-like protein
MTNKKYVQRRSALFAPFYRHGVDYRTETGRLYTGTLSAADDAMNTLDDATPATRRGAGSPRLAPTFFQTPTTTDTADRTSADIGDINPTFAISYTFEGPRYVTYTSPTSGFGGD